jgi:hypothetical protein
MAEISTLYLDLLPDNIPFVVATTKGDGEKSSPSLDNLIIYEDDGTDAVEIVVADEIGNSPFDPINIPTDGVKTGVWAINIAKSNFSAGKFYVFLYEFTIDSIATHKIEVYFFTNSSNFKADVSNLDAAISTRAPASEYDTEMSRIDVPVSSRSDFDETSDPVEIRASGGSAGKNAEEIVDDIWDEPLTASLHNVATSAGRRLRTLVGLVIREEVAQGPGTGTNQIQFDTGASAVDGSYDPAGVAIVAGTGAGQTRLIYQYDGSTKIATVDRDWKVLPAADSEFIIFANPGREHVNEGLAQAGTINTITLNTLASNADGAYIDQTVFIRSGTGADQVRRVSAYNGTTKVATIETNWTTIPDTTSAYTMLPTDSTAEILEDLATIDTNVDSIKAKTDNLPSDPTSEALATANKEEIITNVNNVEVRDVQEG